MTAIEMPTEPEASGPTRAHWWILVVIAGAQLMVVLDSTIMIIALPSAQHGLGFSNADRQWVVTAYTLAFGGFLVLGGRISDMIGTRRDGGIPKDLKLKGKAGDKFSVAATDGLTVDQLAAANGISPFTEIEAGTTLLIPPQGSGYAPASATGEATTAPAPRATIT